MDTSIDKLKERVETLNRLIKIEIEHNERDDKLISQWRSEQIQILKMIIRQLEGGEALLQ
tara:strand:- start:327 stop:506 length:180 start_codon:yes stop_codon:yes gene_type:complete